MIADLVVNHTSDRAPVVPAGARVRATRPYRDCYVWRDEQPPDAPGDVVFPDEETSIWT